MSENPLLSGNPLPYLGLIPKPFCITKGNKSDIVSLKTSLTFEHSNSHQELSW